MRYNIINFIGEFMPMQCNLKRKRRNIVKKEESNMAVLWFILGLFIGCGVGVALACFFQINKLNYYENEIRRLREEMKKQK